MNTGGNLYFESGIDAKKLYAELGKIEGQLSKLTSHAEKQGNKIDSAFKKAATAVGGYFSLQAFGQATKGLYQFSQDVDTALTEVGTISDEVFSKFPYYKEQILDVSTNGAQLGKSLTNALYDIVSAGYDGEQGLEVLRKSARASTAGFVETATAADGITTVLNAWGKDASQAGQVSDVFFKTVEKGKTTFEKLASKIAVVAPLASSMGVSFEEIAGATASLTKQGTPTAEAMTQIRSSLINMNKVLGDGWSDTMTYQEGLQRIAEMAGGSQNELRKLVPDIEGISAILGLTGEKAKVAAQDLEEMNNAFGSTEKAAEKVGQSTEKVIGKLRNNILAALAPMGDDILEKVGEIGAGLNEAFENGNIEEFFADLAKVLKVGAALMLVFKANTIATTASLAAQEVALRILVAREQLLNRWTKLTTITQTAWNAASQAGVGVIGKLTRTTKALFATMASNPLTALIAVAGLAASAFIFLNKKAKTTAEIIEDIADAEKELESANRTKSLIDRYETLKNKTEKTAEEQAEYNKLLKELSEIMPDAVTQVDEYGNALDLAVDKLKKFNEKTRETDIKIALDAVKEAELRLRDIGRLIQYQKEILETGKTREIKYTPAAPGQPGTQRTVYNDADVGTLKETRAELKKNNEEYAKLEETLKNLRYELDLLTGDVEDPFEKFRDLFKGISDLNKIELGQLKSKLNEALKFAPENEQFVAKVKEQIEKVNKALELESEKEKTSLFDLEKFKKELKEAKQAFEEFAKLQTEESKKAFAEANNYTNGDNTFADYLKQRYEDAKFIQEKYLLEIAASEEDIILNPQKESNLSNIDSKGAGQVSDNRGILQVYADEIANIDKQINAERDALRLKDLLKEKEVLEKKRNALLNYKSDSEAIYKKLFEDISGKRIKELKEQLAAIDKQIAKEKDGSLQQIELSKKRGEIEEKIREKTIQTINDISALFGELSNVFSHVDDDLSSAFDTASKIAGAAANIAQGIMTGNYIQSVTAAVGLVAELWNTAEQEAAVYSNQLDLQNRKLQKQIGLLDELNGKAKIRATESAIDETGQDIQSVLNQIQGKRLTGKRGNFWDNSKIDISVAGSSPDEILEQLEHYTNLGFEIDNYDDWMSLIDQYEELIETESGLKKELYEYSTGTTSTALSDDITQMFLDAELAGEDFSEHFADSFGGLMRDTMVKQFKDQQVMNAMQVWYDDFASMSLSGGELTGEEIKDLRESYYSTMDNLQANWESMTEIVPDFFKSSNATSTGGRAGAIKNIQEETAQVLAGDTANLRMKVNENAMTSIQQLNVASEQLTVLTAIKKDTARLENVEKHLKSIDENLSTRAYG